MPDLNPDSFMSGQQLGGAINPDSFMQAFPKDASPPPVHPALAGLPQPQEAVQNAQLNAQQVTDLMTQVGQQMHQSVLAKIPHELRGYTPQELQQPGTFINPRTGQQSTVGGELARVPVLDSPVEGGKQVIQGVEQMAQPDTANKLRGAGKVLTGGVQAASPVMAGLGAAAPLEAAAWYAMSKGTSGLGQNIAQRSGMSPEDAKEAGDVAGALPLVYGFGKMAEGKFSDAIDTHNARAAKLIEQDAAQGRGIDLGQRTTGQEGTPLPNTKGWTVETLGASKQGRPNYIVKDGSGKSLYAGNGRNVQEWLSTQGVERTPAAIPEEVKAADQARMRTVEPAAKLQLPSESALNPDQFMAGETKPAQPETNATKGETNDNGNTVSMDGQRAAGRQGAEGQDVKAQQTEQAEQGNAAEKGEGPVDGQQPAQQPDAGSAANANVQADGQTRPVGALKPLHEMDDDELDRVIQTQTKRDRDLLENLFGADGAKQYDRLYKTAHGSSSKADAAFDKVQAMEESLTKDQRDRLFGINQPEEYNLEEAKSISAAIGRIDPDPASEKDLGDNVKWAISRFDPDEPDADPEAFAQLRRGAQIAQNKGFNTAEVTRAALKGAASRWSDPDDAAFMLDRFRTRYPASNSGAAEQPKRAAAFQPDELERMRAPLQGESRQEWDLSPKVDQAAELVQQAQEKDVPVADIGHKDPEVTALAQAMQRGPDQFAETAKQYAADAGLSRDGAPAGFFEPPTRQEAFDSAFRAPNKLPIRESPAAKEQREDLGDTNIQSVDAAAFQKEFEAIHREPLAWSPERSEALRDLPSFDSYPKVSGRGEGYPYAVNVQDGRHRIAEAARRGKNIDVSVDRGTRLPDHVVAQAPAQESDGAYVRQSRALRPFDPKATPYQQLAQADARFVNEHLYVNRPAADALQRLLKRIRGVDDLSSETTGFTLNKQIATQIGKALDAVVKVNAPPEQRAAIGRLADAFRQAASNGGPVPVTITDRGSDTSGIRHTVRHEGIHVAQDRLMGGTSDVGHIDEKAFLDHTAVLKGATRLVNGGYPAKGSVLASEVPAWVGSGDYAQLGLTRPEAVDVLAHYFGLLFKQHGDKAFSVLARITPGLRKEVYGKLEQRIGRGRDGRLDSAGGEVRSDFGSGGAEGGSSAEKTSQRPSAQPEGTKQSRPIGERLQTGRQGGAGENVRRDSSSREGDVRQARKLSTSKQDEGKVYVHYSRKGFATDVIKNNLNELARAAPEAWSKAVAAATSRSQAAATFHTAIPQVERAMKGEWSFGDLQRGLIESNLRGKAERFRTLAEQAARYSDGNLAKSLPRLEKILPAKVFDRAMESGDPDQVRRDLVDYFNWAAEHVSHVMADKSFQAMSNSPAMKAGLAVFKREIGDPIEKEHVANKGVLQDEIAKGPWNTYYPLRPNGEDLKLPSAPSVDPEHDPRYQAPGNRFNQFASGLGDDYDTSVDALRQRYIGAAQGGSKAYLFTGLKQAGLLHELQVGEKAPAVVSYQGKNYHAVKVQMDDGGYVIRDGKSTVAGPQFGVIPSWAYDELKPILSKDVMPKGTLANLLDKANSVAVAGPWDAVFHSANEMATLTWNAPLLLPALGKTAMTKGIGAVATEAAKILNTNSYAEQNAGMLKRLARIGALSDRFASETYSKKYADLFGAEQKRFNLGPVIYGPTGLDVRGRLFMANLAKSLNPDISDPDLHQWVNQMGTYSQALQAKAVRFAKQTKMSPFAEAGKQMNINGVNMATGMGPMPVGGGKGNALRAYRWLSMVGLPLTLWVLASKAYRGKYPWQDKESRLLEIPLNEKERYSELGKKLYGSGPETGYVNTSFLTPLLMRGLRAIGVKGAADTMLAGGKGWQATEGAEKDVLNSWSHPLLGPIPRALFAALTGKETHLLGLSDRKGNFSPELMPAIRKPGEDYRLAKRGLAAARELSPALFDLGNDAVKALMQRYQNPKWTDGIGQEARPGQSPLGSAVMNSLPLKPFMEKNALKENSYLRQQDANARRRR